MQEWQNGIDSKQLIPLEELYESQSLQECEKEILRKYHKYVNNIHQRLGFNFLFLAKLLCSFDSSSVTGPKSSFLKKLFGKHLKVVVKEGKNVFGIGPKSNQFYDVLFELWLIHRFVELGFNLKLISEKSPEKVPEFKATREDIEYFVEAKNVSDSMLYWIFKDVDEAFFAGEVTNNGIVALTDDQEKGIVDVLDRNFRDALNKSECSEDELLIFINIHSPITLLGRATTLWLKSLEEDMHHGKYGNVSAIVFISGSETHQIVNPNSQQSYSVEFEADTFAYN